MASKTAAFPQVEFRSQNGLSKPNVSKDDHYAGDMDAKVSEIFDTLAYFGEVAVAHVTGP